MPSTLPTSFRLSPRARKLLKALSLKWGYRYREVMERALVEAAGREGLDVSEDKQG